MSGNLAINPGGTPVGYYTPVVVTPAGASLAFISGVLSVEPDGTSFGEGDFEAQMHRVFDLLGAALRSVGSQWADLVKMTTYLTDPDHVGPFYAVRELLFGEYFPGQAPPGNTLLIVRRLVRPEFLIEVEGTATTTRTQGETDEFIG